MKKLLVVLVSLFAVILGIASNQYLTSDFETLNGEGHKWQSSEETWTVVNYFAEWCAPCLRELPELNTFYLQHGSSVRLFAVSYDALSDAELRVLQQKYNIKFPIVKALENTPWSKLPSGLPTTYIIAPDGTLKKELKGEQTALKLEQALETLQGL